MTIFDNLQFTFTHTKPQQQSSEMLQEVDRKALWESFYSRVERKVMPSSPLQTMKHISNKHASYKMRRVAHTSNNDYFSHGVEGIRGQTSDSRKLEGQNSAPPHPHAHLTLSQPGRRRKGAGERDKDAHCLSLARPKQVTVSSMLHLKSGVPYRVTSQRDMLRLNWKYMKAFSRRRQLVKLSVNICNVSEVFI